MSPLPASLLEELYQTMVARCTDESHPEYPYYGGAGKGICKGWRNPGGGFKAFCRDLQHAPLKGRKGPAERAVVFLKDPTKGYCPSNVVVRRDIFEYQGVAL